jgi:hypothetical protein
MSLLTAQWEGLRREGVGEGLRREGAGEGLRREHAEWPNHPAVMFPGRARALCGSVHSSTCRGHFFTPWHRAVYTITLCPVCFLTSLGHYPRKLCALETIKDSPQFMFILKHQLPGRWHASGRQQSLLVLSAPHDLLLA